MKYLNKHNLPERVLRVIRGKFKEPKRPDPKRMSATDIIKEALIRTLYIEKWDDIVVDYSDFLKTTQGNALHDRYEIFADDDDEAEVKLEDEFPGITLVGKADNKIDDYILDVKQTKVYGPQYKLDEWTKQGNIYVWQRRKRGEEINRILIDVWYRDFDDRHTNYKGYPKCGMEVIELPVWSFEEQQQYIEDQLHYHAMNAHTECSDEQKGIRWEVYKNTNKTPSKVEQTKEACDKWVKKEEANPKNSKNKYKVVQSEAKFCNYCKSKSVCPYYKGNK